MFSEDLPYIIDRSEEANIHFVSFKGSMDRFDLAIIYSPSFQNEKVILDLHTNKYGTLNHQTIDEENMVEHAFQYNPIEADEFRKFMKPILTENKQA